VAECADARLITFLAEESDANEVKSAVDREGRKYLLILWDIRGEAVPRRISCADRELQDDSRGDEEGIGRLSEPDK
jgi:hypothetical protein